MPLIRVETKPITVTATVAGLQFGPWPQDVLIRSLFCNAAITAVAGARIPRIGWSLYPGQGMCEAYANSELILTTPPGTGISATIAAFPGAGLSNIRDDTSAVIDKVRWQISIPYNLIIPQQGFLGIFLDTSQADTLSNGVLVYEYGREATIKPGAPRSSKNNP